jgi:hypothetical protein
MVTWHQQRQEVLSRSSKLATGTVMRPVRGIIEEIPQKGNLIAGIDCQTGQQTPTPTEEDDGDNRSRAGDDDRCGYRWGPRALEAKTISEGYWYLTSEDPDPHWARRRRRLYRRELLATEDVEDAAEATGKEQVELQDERQRA